MTDDTSTTAPANEPTDGSNRTEKPGEAPTADVYTLGTDGPRRVDMAALDFDALRTQIGANIDALGEIRWALPRLLFGAGVETISFEARYRLGEMIRTTGETVRLTLEAARTLFELLPDPASPDASPVRTSGDVETVTLAEWRAMMSRPIERVADVVDKVILLHGLSGDAAEWASGMAQVLLDLELLGRSAVASLPVYDDRGEDVDLWELYREWLRLRAADLSDEAVIPDWSAAMATIVDRIMLAPAWTAAGRRLKHEVLRSEISPALSAPGSALDERLPTWLAAMEVDATRRAA